MYIDGVVRKVNAQMFGREHSLVNADDTVEVKSATIKGD